MIVRERIEQAKMHVSETEKKKYSLDNGVAAFRVQGQNTSKQNQSINVE
jgi:hypothetical protein